MFILSEFLTDESKLANFLHLFSSHLLAARLVLPPLYVGQEILDQELLIVIQGAIEKILPTNNHT